MAEIAAFQTAVSAIDLLALAAKIFKRYKEYVDTGHRVPKNLQSLANQLPYLRESLRRHAKEEQAALATGNAAESAFLLAECQLYLAKLESFINELIPEASDSRLIKVKKAIKSVRKEDELKQMQADLSQQITTLSYGSSVSCLSRLAADRCIGKAPDGHVHTIRKAPLKATYGFPTTKVSKFIGRESLVKQVMYQLMMESEQRVVAVLQGMGGQGKTQTALEVCDRPEIRQYFKPILWVNATSEDSTAQAFEHFAQQMAQKGSTFVDSQDKIDFVKERLDDHNRPSLLVFDNYDDLAIRHLGIRNYYPSNTKHAVLVTSRHEDSVNLGEGIQVSEMATDEAVSLLLQRMHIKDTRDATEVAEDIVSHLGHLPLAIAQAGAYISSKKILLHEFLGHYRKRTAAVLQQTPEIWEYGLSVFTTWEMTMEHYSSDKIERNHVDSMLLFCAILHRDVINEEFLSHLLENVHNLPSWTGNFITNDSWDSEKFQEVIAKLGRLSLLQILRYKSGHYDFSIHPMVSDWLRLRVGPHSLSQSISSAMRIVAAFMKSKRGRQMSFEVRREVRTYVWSCLDSMRDIEEDVNSNDLETDTIMESKFVFADFMYTDMQLTNGTVLFEEILKVWERRLGGSHNKTISAAKQLARGYTKKKMFAEAEELNRRISASPEGKFSCALADCYSAQAKYAEAGKMYEDLLLHLQTEAGPRNRYTIHCMLNMAQNFADGAQAAQNRLDDRKGYYSWAFSEDAKNAENLWLAVLENAEEWQGERSEVEEVALDRAEAFTGLGCLHHDRGLQAQEQDESGSEYFAQAQDMQQKALLAFECLYGADHQRVLTASHNLAVSLNLDDKFAESEKMYQRTLDGYEQVYGPDHELTVNICHCYGHVLASQWKVLEGSSLHTRSYMGLEEMLGPGDAHTLSVFGCLAKLYRSIDNKLEIEKLYLRALAKRSEVLGPDHRITLDTANELGFLYLEERRWNDAEGYLRQATDGYSRNSGIIGPSRDEKALRAMEGMVIALHNHGKSENAEQMARELLEMREELHGRHHPDTLQTATDLAMLLQQQGKNEEAERIHETYEDGYDKVVERGEEARQEIEEGVTRLMLEE